MDTNSTTSSVPPVCIVCQRVIPTAVYETGPHGPFHDACSGRAAVPYAPTQIYPWPYQPWGWGQIDLPPSPHITWIAPNVTTCDSRPMFAWNGPIDDAGRPYLGPCATN